MLSIFVTNVVLKFDKLIKINEEEKENINSILFNDFVLKFERSIDIKDLHR